MFVESDDCALRDAECANLFVRSRAVGMLIERFDSKLPVRSLKEALVFEIELTFVDIDR